jgi:hypothetical protein
MSQPQRVSSPLLGGGHGESESQRTSPTEQRRLLEVHILAGQSAVHRGEGVELVLKQVLVFSVEEAARR